MILYDKYWILYDLAEFMFISIFVQNEMGILILIQWSSHLSGADLSTGIREVLPNKVRGLNNFIFLTIVIGFGVLFLFLLLLFLLSHFLNFLLVLP